LSVNKYEAIRFILSLEVADAFAQERNDCLCTSNPTTEEKEQRENSSEYQQQRVRENASQV